MKKIIIAMLMISMMFICTSDVYASDYVDKITLNAAFATDVDTDKIDEIRVSFEVTPSNGEEWHLYETKILKENNYQLVIENQVLKGEILIHVIMVFPDAGGTIYSYEYSFNKINEDNYVGQINVMNRVLNTSSTARTDVIEDAIYDHIMDESDRNKYEPTTKKTTTTGDSISTTNQPDGTTTGTGNSDIIIGDSTTTTTKEVETTTSEEERKAKEEEEKRKEKEDLVLTIMLVTIGIVVVVFVLVTAVKIYQANKLI